MFGHVFFVLIGLAGFVLGFKEQDYFWAVISLFVAMGAVIGLYQLKTGKEFFGSKNNK